MKRTKRYGGFRIGDKVQRKDGKFIKFQPALVIGFSNGYIRTHWTMNDGTYFESVFAPNQLINLTRIEESKRKIIDPLPPISEETADELIERVQRMQMENWKPEDHDIMAPKQKERELTIEELKEIAKDYADTLREGILEYSDALIRIFFGNLPSPYTRDVYTSTKDY